MQKNIKFSRAMLETLGESMRKIVYAVNGARVSGTMERKKITKLIGDHILSLLKLLGREPHNSEFLKG